MKRLNWTRAVAIIASIVAIAAFFLPYISANEDYREYLDTRADEKIFEHSNITAGDVKDLSLFEYALVYYQGGGEIFSNRTEEIFYAVLFGLAGLLPLCVLLLALGKKTSPHDPFYSANDTCVLAYQL